jgi:hypothetical protein
VGYAILTGRININFKTTTKISNSIGKWNVTDSWVGKNKIYYYRIIIKIDNKDGPVLANEREVSFKIPIDIITSESNIWVAENYRISQDRLYLNCYSWVTNQQPITLEFQLAYSKNTDIQISNLSFKNNYVSDFIKDPKLKK